MTDPILVAVLTFITTATAAVLIYKRLASELHTKLKVSSAQANEAERQVHLKEMEYLAERNKAEIAHVETLNQARALAFEEGRRQGRAEHELETVMLLADQRNEFAIRLQAEKEQVAAEARDRQRAEYELQAKLFSVKISPYVQLLTDKGLIYDTYEAKAGYQYQLLVNGIPAFQPHIVVERHEKVQEIDQAIKNTFLSLAKTCAEAAVTTYLGASPQFAKLAPEVIEQIEKK
ncbi:MAG: hypothetical protein U1F55_03865 [Chitinivorax sp.]